LARQELSPEALRPAPSSGEVGPFFVTQDGQYVAGFTWTRQGAFRVTKNFNNKVWAAFAVKSPETTYSATFVPANIMWLNTSPNAAAGVNLLAFLANYSQGFATEMAPDLLAKVAFEPGWGSGPGIDHPVVTMEAAETF